jgi:predicted enzyme related to lactoylglutathione lyase
MKRFLMTAIALFTMTAVFATSADSSFGVGAQYDTTHVYVQPEDFGRFVDSLLATFGGSAAKQGVFTVTPTPSKTMSQLVLTPVGTLSVFGFKTPVPYPFGGERTGYLVTNLDAAVRAAQADGADVLVSPFDDPIGKDAVIQWPGGVNMQLYWHTTPPSYPALQTVPENRVYVSPERAAAFVRSFLAFSHGKLVSDNSRAPGVEIGRPSDSYRRIRISSVFGAMAVLVTDGHLPHPYGREMTGYEVANLAGTLEKAKVAGVSVLDGPFSADGRTSAMVQFPGGYIAEIHSAVSEK